MGRHRSTLRDLGWSSSNSPNPWKQGSAKRVVRALDYSTVENEEARNAEAAASGDRSWENRMQQLQHDGALLLHTQPLIPSQAPSTCRTPPPCTQAFGVVGLKVIYPLSTHSRPPPIHPHTGRQQLDRIRQQFEAEDAENKRKLDRLNGCARAPLPGRSAFSAQISLLDRTRTHPAALSRRPFSRLGPRARAHSLSVCLVSPQEDCRAGRGAARAADVGSTRPFPAAQPAAGQG